MRIVATNRNTLDLPLALLPNMKAHSRIDHCDDDQLLADKLSMVIERFEINNGVAVFESVYSWVPDQWSNGRTKIPRPPVRSFSAQAGDPLTDVSSAYVIETSGWGGEIAPAWLVGDWQSGLELVVNAGYLATTLPPGIRDAVLTCAAHLYEYREIYLQGNVEMQAMWIDKWISGYWQAYC